MKTALRRYHRCVRFRFWTSCVSAYATCITAYEPNRLMSTGFVPSIVSTVCVTRQPWAAAKSRHFCLWLANERKVSVSTHRQALAAFCCSSTARCCAHWICHGFRRSEDLGRRGACRWCCLDEEVVRILGFWKASIVCSPSFCMERACGSVRFATAGQDLVSITARSSVRGQSSQGSWALMLPEENGTQPARAKLSRARAWWLKDRPRAAAIALPVPLSGSIRAPGILAVVLGFCAARIQPIHGAVSCVAITCSDEPFSAPSKRAVDKQAS